MMQLKDFDFELPEELIAQYPSERGYSKLLHVDKHGNLFDRVFYDILNFVQPGDLFVFNNTKVVPALLKAYTHHNTLIDNAFDINLLTKLSDSSWQVLVEPIGKLTIGETIYFDDKLSAQVISKDQTDDRIYVFEFNKEGKDLISAVKLCGNIPLPPYIKRWKKASTTDVASYQTVYAKEEGAVAAPTAGLHFNEDIIERIKTLGGKVAYVTLHVGGGTFLSIKTDNVDDHKMHSEEFDLNEEACSLINSTKRNGGRIISVGTTSTRVLESNSDEKGFLSPCRGQTRIFIKPGYQFKVVDALVTNFHIPKSTLFMLVCAFSGYEIMKKAYRHAIQNQYKFYSYGDTSFLERPK